MFRVAHTHLDIILGIHGEETLVVRKALQVVNSRNLAADDILQGRFCKSFWSRFNAIVINVVVVLIDFVPNYSK